MSGVIDTPTIPCLYEPKSRLQAVRMFTDHGLTSLQPGKNMQRLQALWMYAGKCSIRASPSSAKVVPRICRIGRRGTTVDALWLT